MGWNGYSDKANPSGAGGNKTYIEEGNIKKFLFTENATKVKFLTEDDSPEGLMSELGITREEAEDRFFTKTVNEKWVLPFSYWEHQIKEIPGKRYFATAACRGRGSCELCVENDKDRANGVNENKLLAYPVRKRFMVPAYIYDLSMVLFVVGNEEFFNDVATYINRNGSNSIFEIWKTGKGLNTKYKSAYVGPADDRAMPKDYPAPNQVNLLVPEAELHRRLNGGKPTAQPAQQPQGQNVGTVNQQPAPKSGPGAFEVTFGSHKGKTLQQLFDLGEREYIEFLAKNSAGAVQETARAFLEGR